MDEETFLLFRAEAESLGESLEEQLLALRDAPQDKALIDGVFRDLHTLKGSGAMFGRTDLAAFLHEFESAFEAVRNGSVEVDSELISISLAARDHVTRLLDSADAGAGADILARLQSHLTLDRVGAAFSPAANDEAPWHLRFTLSQNTIALGGKPALVLAELVRVGARNIRSLLDQTKWDPAREDQGETLSWQAEVDAATREDDIRGAFLFYEDGLDLVLERAETSGASVSLIANSASHPNAVDDHNEFTLKVVPAEEKAPSFTATESVGPTQVEVHGSRGPSYMRVPAERLDEMMNRVGELVIAEARLIEIALRSGEQGLVQVAEDIQRLVTAMRDTAMSIRMTPIGTIVGRFKRLVYDLGVATGKAIDFNIESEETELDKTVLERLTDPLMHLIRNAADHGLEVPGQRRIAGKPERGQLRLGARYSGAEIC